MQLSQSSWHARVYILSYGEESGFPNNLCPYFWRLLLAVILFIPLCIWYIPLRVVKATVNYFVKEEDKIDLEVREEGMLSTLIILTLFVNSSLFLITCMLLMWFFLSGNAPIVTVGILGWIIAAAIVLIVLYNRYKEKRPVSKEPSFFQITKEYFKARYKKYCPQITWK